MLKMKPQQLMRKHGLFFYLQRKIEKPVAYTDWTVYNKMINCAVQRMSMFKDDLQNIIDDKEAMQEFFKDIKDSGE